MHANRGRLFQPVFNIITCGCHRRWGISSDRDGIRDYYHSTLEVCRRGTCAQPAAHNFHGHINVDIFRWDTSDICNALFNCNVCIGVVHEAVHVRNSGGHGATDTESASPLTMGTFPEQPDALLFTAIGAARIIPQALPRNPRCQQGALPPTI